MSPIEREMLEAFHRAHAADESAPRAEADINYQRRCLAVQRFGGEPILMFGAGWSLFREHRIGTYRADFVLVSFSGFVAVECDGHDFHDRTPEQAIHDRKRDRFFAKNGWLTLRFTGREIRHGADACVAEVFEVCGELDGRFIADFTAVTKAIKHGSPIAVPRYMNEVNR